MGIVEPHGRGEVFDGCYIASLFAMQNPARVPWCGPVGAQFYRLAQVVHCGLFVVYRQIADGTQVHRFGVARVNQHGVREQLNGF